MNIMVLHLLVILLLVVVKVANVHWMMPLDD
jgi:hypothetical protein